ncbi:CpaF family protein [Phytoactinopolyspora endophytica]|uniref:CpaF family protein n=1 Tax=Phytoactinopolyspora endophytica TaxID=1642495 RepID=UPI00101D5524|nr:ATPase, T2SS/T4P/T4SS family [Phytoactinopolyspora endophytica]
MDAVEIIVGDVRDLVRREGIDPVAERKAVRRIVDDVVVAYQERSLSRPLPPLDDVEKATRAVVDIVAGYGPLQAYLDDPEVEEIWVNEPGRVFVARRGRSELTTVILTADEVRSMVERMLKSSGRRVDFSNPFVDAMLPDGSRLHVVIPEVTRHWCVNIRKHVLPASSLDDLVRFGTLTSGAAQFLDACVVSGLNVLVSGGTQAGKTTVLNCLLAAIPARERVITCEEVLELRVPLPDVVSMQTRQASLEGTGEISLRRLVKEALRMRPDRLVVGEVRQEESFDLLMALNSGKPGACTLHANSAREAVVKLSLLPLLAGTNIGSEFIVPTVAGCVDLVVHVELDHDGQRRVREIVAVPGRVEDEVIELEPIFVRRGDRLVRADGHPPHAERFSRAGFDVTKLLDRQAGKAN